MVLGKVFNIGFMLSTMVLVPIVANAQGTGASGLEVPRFVSLASNEVNLRTGPGLKYPIEWVLTREGLPVEVVREFDTWREIKTVDGDVGWVHSSLLSGKRTVLVDQYTRKIFNAASADSRPIAQIEPGVVADVDKCEKQWCHIDVLTYDGWIEKSSVWGVYDHEVFD